MLKLNTFYSWILSVIVIGSLIASIFVVYKIDPTENVQSIIYFYLATGTFLLSSSSLVLFFLRQKFGTKEMVKSHIQASLRQGFWITLLYATAMFLQSKGLFTWLNAVFLVFALTFLESYYLYNERKTRTN